MSKTLDRIREYVRLRAQRRLGFDRPSRRELFLARTIPKGVNVRRAEIDRRRARNKRARASRKRNRA